MTTATDEVGEILGGMKRMVDFMRENGVVEMQAEDVRLVLAPPAAAAAREEKELDDKPMKPGKPGRDGLFAHEQEQMYGRIVDASPEE